MTCRRRHRKCDERRPTCALCQSRGLECSYGTTLRWTDVGNIISFNSAIRHKNKSAPRAATTSTNASISLAVPRNSSPKARSPGATSIHRVEGQSSQILTPLQTANESADSCPSLVDTSTIDPGSDLTFAQTLRTLQSPPPSGPCLSWQGIDQNQTFHDVDSTRCRHVSSVDNEMQDLPQLGGDEFNESPVGNSVGSTPSQDLFNSPSSNSWIVNNAFDGFFAQIFQDPGEEIAFSYCQSGFPNFSSCPSSPPQHSSADLPPDLNRVCTCIPAFDSSHNPYRQMALAALSYPVLLHGIISVSTGHMHNYGRSNERLLSSRQSRALNSLQLALNALQRNKDCDKNHVDPLLEENSVFSVLSARELALGAIMMQTSSVLMTGIGNVEVHMKCALHFIQDLGYLQRLSASVFSRLLIYRFAMVDVVLAHLRFRRPLASLDFFMYQDQEDLDQEEPSFREMHGCAYRVLQFLAQIAVLTAELMSNDIPSCDVQAKAYVLETEMRAWGKKYHYNMLSGQRSNSALSSATAMSTVPVPNQRADLETVCECFYWTSNLLLIRRVFLDSTRSTRVQIIRRHIFRLMDQLLPGCGPDSSLPFPFYIASREAITLEERDWVRRKHAAMMESYQDRSREYMMATTEKIWEKMSTVDSQAIPSSDIPLWDTPMERFIRETDRQATYFMF